MNSPTRTDKNKGGVDVTEDGAQMTVDFVIAVVIFVGSVVLAVQFVSSTASPVLSDNRAIENHNTGDRLYYDKLSEDSLGSLNLSYFFGPSGDLKSESDISEELSLDGDGIRIDVTETDTGDTVELNGKEVSIGRNPPDAGAAASEVSRIGHTETNGTVVMKVRVW